MNSLPVNVMLDEKVSLSTKPMIINEKVLKHFFEIWPKIYLRISYLILFSFTIYIKITIYNNTFQ
jgi:hypothetical protein